MQSEKISLPVLFGAAVALGHLWLNTFALPALQTLATFHFASLALVLLLIGQWPSNWPGKAWQITSTVLPAAAAIFLLMRTQSFHGRGMAFTELEFVAALVVVLGAIELARRSGWLVAAVIAVFVTYALWWGQFLTGPLAFPGLALETILFRSVYTDDGMFGTIAGISASFVFIFVLFGAFLMRSGGGEFVVDLARVASRRFVGGSGYVAVAASALTGTISGSAVANTMTTGIVTIPLMKRSGFRPPFAGAVEAAASTGGQLMPPIMGAGVFLIASYTQTPYADIVAISIVPALLFFFSIFLGIRIEAKRTGMMPFRDAEADQSMVQLVRERGASFLIPVAGVVVMLALGYTAIWAGAAGIAFVIVISWMTSRPMRPRDIILALAAGANGAALTCLLLVAIGLVVNVVAMTGLGATFSLMIIEWSAGNLILALLLVAIASLVLGMGLPVTAAYVVLATLSAPALAQIVAMQTLITDLAIGQVSQTALPLLSTIDPQMAALGNGEAAARALLQDLSPDVLAVLISATIDPAVMAGFLIAAHLAIFWLSQDSNVTPPVCLTGYAAAAIAGSRPLHTGAIAWRIAKSIYVMPILFFTTPILDGTLVGALIGGAIGLLALCLMLIALEGFLQSPVRLPVRGLMLAVGAALLVVEEPTIRSLLAIVAISLLAMAAFSVGAPAKQTRTQH